MLSPVDEKYQQIQTWERQGDALSIDGICGMLADDDPQVRGQAALVLGKLRSPRAVKPLLVSIQDRDGAARLKAIEALGRIGDPAGAPGLIKLLEDPVLTRLMLGMRPPGAETVPLVQLQRAQGHAWDVLWAAATALGRIGEPAGLSAVLHWAERLALSDVRVFSIEEKSELVRAVVEPLFPRLTPADIYDLSKSIHPSSISLSWEPATDGGDDLHWAAAVRDNPLHRLFKAELERRKNEYMKTLRNPADTLFGSGAARSAQAANLADTLFGTREAAAANVADTLFVAGDNRAPAQYSRQSGPPVSADDLTRLRESLVASLGQHEKVYFPSRGAALAAADEPFEEIAPEVAQAKAQEYQKTLGKADTLFSTSHLNPQIANDFDEEEMLFLNEDQARVKQDVKMIPAARPELMTPDQAAAKMAAYQKTLGKADTLFSTSHIKASEIPTNWMDDDDLFETGQSAPSPDDDSLPVMPPTAAPPELVAPPAPVAPEPEPAPLVYRPKPFAPTHESHASQEGSHEPAALEETPLEPIMPLESALAANTVADVSVPIYEEAPPVAPQPSVAAARLESGESEGFDPNLRLPHPLRTAPKPPPLLRARPPVASPQAPDTAPQPRRGLFGRFFGWLFRR